MKNSILIKHINVMIFFLILTTQSYSQESNKNINLENYIGFKGEISSQNSNYPLGTKYEVLNEDTVQYIFPENYTLIYDDDNTSAIGGPVRRRVRFRCECDGQNIAFCSPAIDLYTGLFLCFQNDCNNCKSSTVFGKFVNSEEENVIDDKIAFVKKSGNKNLEKNIRPIVSIDEWRNTQWISSNEYETSESQIDEYINLQFYSEDEEKVYVPTIVNGKKVLIKLSMKSIINSDNQILFIPLNTGGPGDSVNIYCSCSRSSNDCKEAKMRAGSVWYCPNDDCKLCDISVK